MNIFLKIIVLLFGICSVAAVVYLLIKKKINERNSLFWLIGSFIILVIAIIPEAVDFISGILGIDYPPALLFLIAILILFFVNLYHSMQISMLNTKLTELTQYIAINNNTNNKGNNTDDSMDDSKKS